MMNKLNLKKIVPISISHFKRCKCDYQSNYEVLTNCLGLSYEEAQSYISQHKLITTDTECFSQSLKYCKELGFSDKDILKYPTLLRYNPSTLDQYYTVMTEGGFHRITAYVLAKFRTLCRRPVKNLKNTGLIKPGTNVAKSFIKHLNPLPDDFPISNHDSFKWEDIHHDILTNYLKWRLKVTNDVVENLVRVHPTMVRKSFKYLCENIATAEDLGFTPDKMIKYGYILLTHPQNTRNILERYPEIAGFSMRRAMRMYPKMVTVPLSNIEKILDILKEHNIPDEAIKKRMNILHLSPKTVSYRLNELKKDPDLKVLFYNPNILKLVIHHNRAKSRLTFLNKLQIRCAGVSLLGNDDAKFNIHVKEGRDAHSVTDVYSFLKGVFKTERDQLENQLRKHPYYLQVPLSTMEKTFNYLKKENFTPEVISSAVYILLYPKEKIKAALERVHLFGEQNKRNFSKITKLNLVLYFIEKEHHFSGDGVWNKAADDGQEDQLLDLSLNKS